MLVYVLLGAVGVPVFAGFRGGVDRVVGPTGGYIIGYIFMALVIGLLVSVWGSKFFASAVAMLAEQRFAICSAPFGIWFRPGQHFSRHNGLCDSIFAGDAVKILLASFCSGRLQRMVRLSDKSSRAK